jgi:predicted ribosome quality control (RQC) complex YloA/Tae2 family protein
MDSLTLNQIKILHQEIAPLIQFQAFISLSYIEERKFILHIGDFSILLCFQDPFLRFHLTKIKKDCQKTAFSESINNTLNLSVLEGFSIANEDRILQFLFKTKDNSFILLAELFPKKPNFYLLDSEMQIINCLNPVNKTIYTFPESKNTFKDHLKTDLSSINSLSVEKFYNVQEIALRLENKKHEVKATLKGRIKQLQKQQETCKKSLELALKWESIKHEGELLQANFRALKRGMTEICLPDWELENAEVVLELNPKLIPKAEIEQRFKKAKKLKTGITYHQKQLVEIESRINILQDEIEKLEHIETLKELLAIYPEKKLQNKVQETVLPFREYESKTGFKIWVGKNSSSNDALTFKYAKGHDLWLHVKDYPGSHVVIRTKKSKTVDQETIDDAVQVAIFYSKAKEAGSAEVCLTEKKFVSRFGKKKDGKVQISKQRVIFAKADKERFKALQHP